jgi:hypothetical protein
MDKVVGITVLAAGLFTSSLLIVGQAVFDPTAEVVERVIGGSVLLATGWVVVRWLFRLLNAIRDDSEATRQMLESERTAWKEERDSLRVMLTEARSQYESERQLRLSLEEKGIVDRRRKDE